MTRAETAESREKEVSGGLGLTEGSSGAQRERGVQTMREKEKFLGCEAETTMALYML
jgi:hypothetical protein